MAILVYDCIFSILLFALGIYIKIVSADFYNKKSHYVEIVYWAIFIFALANLILAVRKLYQKNYDESIRFSFPPKLIIFSIITILFAVSVNYLGFYLPAIAFIFVCSNLIGKQNKWVALLVSILIVTALNVIFSHFLNIEFPKGIFSEIAIF